MEKSFSHPEELFAELKRQKHVSDFYAKVAEQQHKESKIDNLTEIANGMALDEHLRATLDQQPERRQPKQGMLVMFVDGKKFKYFNDTYGQIEGNKIIKKIAEHLDSKAIKRETDFLARIGGDEFIIVFHGMTIEDFKNKFGDRLVPLQVELRGKNGERKTETVEFSCGVYRPSASDTDPAETIRKANLAMQKAKDDVMGSIRFYDESLELEAEELESRKRS